MERAVLLSGIGGQGIQLAARTLATAAVLEGREVMSFGVYGGAMRGGPTAATVVMGTERLLSPPTISSAWGALVMHHTSWDDAGTRLIAGGIAVIDHEVARHDAPPVGVLLLEVKATDIAIDLALPQAASMVLLGAFAAATGLVRADSLVAAISEALPQYRRQHAERNAIALRTGSEVVARAMVSPWDPTSGPTVMARVDP